MGGADQGKRDLRRLASGMKLKLAENFRAVFYAPFYATAALGLYEQNDVAVELVTFSGAGEGVSALLDGKVDVAWGGPMRVMKAHDADPGSPLVCFGEVVARDPFYLVAANRCDSATLEDLPALQFAAVCEVPTPWLCLQHDLRARGIDPARLDRTPQRPMAVNLQALGDGRLDVAQLFEPYVSMILQEGAGRILYAASTRGPTVYTTLISTRAATERHRHSFRRMLRAIAEMQNWLVSHTADELAEITASYFPEIARQILVSAFARYRESEVWAQTCDVSKAGFARLGECLLSGGFLSRPPVYEECVELSLGQP
jgi:NitT/TauT family transport system substrate-binding protein